jgi:hypothetical protein
MPNKTPDKSKKAAPALSEADEAVRKLRVKRIREITEQCFNEAQVTLSSIREICRTAYVPDDFRPLHSHAYRKPPESLVLMYDLFVREIERR